MRGHSLWRILVIHSCTGFVFYETVTVVGARGPVPKIKASKLTSVSRKRCFSLSSLLCCCLSLFQSVHPLRCCSRQPRRSSREMLFQDLCEFCEFCSTQPTARSSPRVRKQYHIYQKGWCFAVLLQILEWTAGTRNARRLRLSRLRSR